MAVGNTLLQLGNKGAVLLPKPVAGLRHRLERGIQGLEVGLEAGLVGLLETFAPVQQQAAGGAAGMDLDLVDGGQLGGQGHPGPGKAQQQSDESA